MEVFSPKANRVIKVELVSGSNEHEYEEFISRCSCALAQHTLGWRDVITSVGVDVPVYLLARDYGKVVGALPAFLYRCDIGNLMLSVPQAGGYGGVVVEQGFARRAEVYDALLKRLVSEAAGYDCLCVTVCTPPLFGDISLYREYLRPDFELENFFQYLDLNTDFVPDISRRHPRLRENIRRNVRKAQAHGLLVTAEDKDAFFDQWYEIYLKRMGEVGADVIPRRLFEGIRRRLLPEGRGFFSYVLDGGRVIGGGVFVGLNQVVDYYMGCADSGYEEKQPNSLLMYETMRRALGRGYRYWNWQSSSSRRSPVYHYKAGWGSREGAHYYLTKAVGDISELRGTPLSVIKERYRGHYVLPYSEFEVAAQAPDAGGHE